MNPHPPLFRNVLFACLALTSFATSCRRDVGMTSDGYPVEISKIISARCAVPGCHTSQSKEAAAGLSLETWEEMFKGDRNGAVCIPYRHDYSTLFLFCNTDSSAGPVNTPTMPLNSPPLSVSEMNTLIGWIGDGAPRADGKIAFADNPDRKKVYVTNQSCDEVTVFDAASQLQMRYIHTGSAPAIESPHTVRVSPDGKYWYVVLSGGTVLQKFRCSDDSWTGEAILGTGTWNTMAISADSKYGYVVDWTLDARIARIDLDNMSVISTWSGQMMYPDAHGSAINASGDTLYLTSQSGNFIMKVPVSDPTNVDTVVLSTAPGAPISTHEIAFAPDYTHYFVTCQNSDEVRVVRTSDDALVAVIPVGDFPAEMSFSKTKPYLFVSCEWDQTPPETNKGSVAVIDYSTHTLIKNLRLNLSEPHGIGVDDMNGLVYVGNRNISGGSVPHHTSVCNGSNGFISFIDLNTLTVIADKKIEIAVDPYSIAVR